jgi:tetratricopeptide (TPR) repeat protein
MRRGFVSMLVIAGLALSPGPALGAGKKGAKTEAAAKGGKSDAAGKGGKGAKSEAAEAAKADKEGQKLEKKKEFDQAKEAYLKSLELKENAETRIRLAGVEEKLGHLVEANDQLKKVMDDSTAKGPSRKKAEAKQKKIEPRIPSLMIETPKTFKGTVYVDDSEQGSGSLASPIPMNPGSHKVKAESEGMSPFNESVELAEKDKKTVTVKMAESTPEPVAAAAEPEADKPVEKKSKGGGGSTGKTLGFVSIGVGIVGVGVGTYFGLKARSTKKDLDDACNDNVCTQAERSKYDDGKKQANISTIGFVVGAVGIGVGTVLLLTSGGSSKEGKTAKRRHVTPYVGPGSAGVFGSF